MFGLNQEEIKILKPLNTPRKIQAFLDTLKINFEKGGETCQSPRRVLQSGRAHCLEGALLAAAALRMNGEPPLVLDLTASDSDDDHVVALFRQHGAWGALSKTNHAVLRYREPVYKTLRELALSYFHEYFTHDGRKTLRSFSKPVNLCRFDRLNWLTTKKDLWEINDYLSEVKHFPILNRGQLATLRPADPLEIKAGKLTEW